MAQVDEKTLQKWEKNPLQYRHEIMALEKRMYDELRERVDHPSPTVSRHGAAESRVRTRLVRMLTAIDRHESRTTIHLATVPFPIVGMA
jgi:hypothetical protein